MLKLALRYRSYHVFQPRKLSKDILKSAPTHELLQTLGFVRQSQSGLVNWLPMGLRSLNKIESIIRHRMSKDGGALEVQLSTLSPKSLWEATGRWSNTELFKLKDAKKASYCLTPTCEEDITFLMKNYISSYKDLPLLVYQITRKYRDELRPRGGLLRGREFLMKDAYSFATSKEEAIGIFEKVNHVYEKIFTDLKIPFLSAWADSGDIGGDMSKEYHYLHPSGEDTLMKCEQCGISSNVEKCESFPQETGQHMGDVDVKYALSKDHSTLVCLYYPRGRQLNWNLALESVDRDLDAAVREKSNEEVLRIFQESNEDVMFAQILRIMDCRLSSRSNYPDFPLRNYLKNNFGQIDDVSLVDAIKDEICGSCNEGQLKAHKTIEVGHTFHLGTKYSELLEAKFTDRENKSSIVEMGCFGIGVSRLLGAIGEITRDERGFRWPSSIAPYTVSVCVAPGNETLTSQIKQQLDSSVGEDAMYDFNDKMGLGARINYSHAIGVPLCVIAGPKNWPKVEIEVRGKNWTKNHDSNLDQEYEALKSTLQWETTTDQLGSEKHTVPVHQLAKVISHLSKGL